MSKKKDQEEGERLLNKKTSNLPSEIDRGVELLLRNKKGREESKTLQFKLNKMISLFRREFYFNIDFSFDIKKNP
tara:strand:- start:2029 stop:2253 length:225 start_codon:yes stop_codon:yes gene_type:complete